MGYGRILLKLRRDDSFKKVLSNETNFGRIHLTGQYLWTQFFLFLKMEFTKRWGVRRILVKRQFFSKETGFKKKLDRTKSFISSPWKQITLKRTRQNAPQILSTNNLWKDFRRKSSFISLIFNGYKEPIVGQSVCLKTQAMWLTWMVLLPESCWNDATATAHFHSWTGDRASQPPPIDATHVVCYLGRVSDPH